MEDLHVELRLPRPDALVGAADQLMSALRKASPTLALALANSVRGRAPRNTGALREDITAQPYTSSVSGTREVKLVDLYCEQGAQLSEWGRVYASYQEGPPLGQSTYTNEPHQMFYLVASDDLGLIEDWASAAIEGESERLANLPEETLVP